MIDRKEPLFSSFGGQQKISATNHSNIDIMASFNYRQPLIIKLFSFVAHPVLSSNQRAKLKKDPERFFRDANNRVSRYVAKKLHF